MPNLVMISQNYNPTDESPILARRSYVEVVSRKNKKSKDARSKEKLCSPLTPAIHTDGMNKGRLVKVCADLACKIQFGNLQQEEKQRPQWKAEKTAANKKAKQTLAFRHRLLADVLKRVKPHFGTDELRIVAQFVFCARYHMSWRAILPNATACKIRETPMTGKWPKKARMHYKKADAAGLAALIFESMLIGRAGSRTVNRDGDLLTDAASHYKVDTKALRIAVAQAEKGKAQKKNKVSNAKRKSATKPKTVHK
jgi:hypothetical protein